MAELSEAALTKPKTILSMSIGDMLQFMQKLLPLNKQGFKQDLQFMSLELIDSESHDTVSLVLTVRKY
jgi:hypothetical protein